ncbi:MAG: glucokinase [Alphaproteobacteria bacterium]
MAHHPTLLLADIGGTNARFTLFRDERLIMEPVQWLAAAHKSLPDAMGTFVAEHLPAGLRLDGVAVCGAGPVKDGHIPLTNSPWTVDAGEIAAVTRVPDPVVVNDFTAMAMGAVKVGADHLDLIKGDCLDPTFPIGVLGPGTGLGVSGLIPDGRGGHIPLSGEGGHVDLAPTGERDMAVLFQLMQMHGHVSAETVLCGPGLETLFLALAQLNGQPVVEQPAAVDITMRARGGRCPLSVEAVALFTHWLGAVSGNLALTLGARGGVVLTGGILPKWGDLFDRALFRQAFEAKGTFRAYNAPIPTALVTGGHPAMLGLAALWDQSQRGWTSA